MTNVWQVKEFDKCYFDDTIFIEGLPGIGNVGKVVVDFLIEHFNAQLFAQFVSHTLPNSVFINEDHLVELPKIEMYAARIKEQDYLFMTGDVQPSDEVSSYQFCELVLECVQKWGAQSIITLGGIGLQDAPLEPSVYCTGNNKDFVAGLQKAGANPEVYGIVGPIIGVSGLLLGLAKEKNIPAGALLAETFGHPMYLGLRGAKSVLSVLQTLYSFTYDFEKLDEEILHMEQEDDPKKTNPRIDSINKLKRPRETNYIG